MGVVSNCTHTIKGYKMNTEKEQYRLFKVVDDFFDTKSGFKMINTPLGHVEEDGTTIYTDNWQIDRNAPHIIHELGRLGVILCGGAINSMFTGNTVNDLDFYVKHPENIGEVRDLLSRYFPDEVYYSMNAITFKRHSKKSRKKWTVQLITRFHGAPKEIFEWFDFTITHGAYDFAKCEFEFGDRFFPDLAKRQLVYSGASRYPICAMYRTKKYQERGYHVSGATIMHIALCIVQLKIATYRELKEQLMGIDTMYLQGLLDAKEPDAPVNYGDFVAEAFKALNSNGYTMAEEDDEHN